MDARRGEIYAALYHARDGKLAEVESPRVWTATVFAARIATLPQVILCGDGSKVYQDLWRDHPKIQVAPRDWDRPSANQLVRIAAREWQESGPIKLAELGPEYLRRVEAELRLEEKLNEAHS